MKYLRPFVSDILLFAFALAELCIFLIPIAIAPDHTAGLWYEDNMAILGIEIAVCLAAMAWAAYHIRKRVKVYQCDLEY